MVTLVRAYPDTATEPLPIVVSANDDLATVG
jgi:hypothetical protein